MAFKWEKAPWTENTDKWKNNKNKILNSPAIDNQDTSMASSKDISGEPSTVIDYISQIETSLQKKIVMIDPFTDNEVTKKLIDTTYGQYKQARVSEIKKQFEKEQNYLSGKLLIDNMTFAEWRKKYPRKILLYGDYVYEVSKKNPKLNIVKYSYDTFLMYAQSIIEGKIGIYIPGVDFEWGDDLTRVRVCNTFISTLLLPNDVKETNDLIFGNAKENATNEVRLMFANDIPGNDRFVEWKKSLELGD